MKSSKSSWEDDVVGISVLTLLYALQGIPLGLAFGSLPFVLSEKLSYADQADFSISAYPYSLKLLWSPIVDVVYSSKWGRRKSWIFPMQFLMGITMLYISSRFDEWSGMDNDAEGAQPKVKTLTAWFFWLIFLTATQDIAVDGWALTILSEGNRELQAMCQTVGQTFGYALAFPVFLALNSPETCIKWFGTAREIVTPSSFLMICGMAVLVTNVVVVLFIPERPPTKQEQVELDRLNVQSTYSDIMRILKMHNVLKLVMVLLTCRLAFCCVDNAAGLKLLELGYPKESAGLLVFFLVPFELMFPLFISYVNGYLKWSKMELWRNGYRLRLAVSILSVSMVAIFAADADGQVPLSFLLRQICVMVCYSFSSSIMFTAQCGFFAKIADETIGGTYLTLLNTVANLGNTWPKWIVLRSIDWLTTKHEIPCAVEKVDGSQCFQVDSDGFYYVAAGSLLIGITWILYSSNVLKEFDQIPKSQWTVKRKKIDID